MENYNFGALRDKKDNRDFKFEKLVGAAELPEEFKHDLKAEIKNQGSLPTCVSFASATIKNSHEGIDMAEGFIYWLAMRDDKATKTSGMYFRDAARYLAEVGEIPSDMMKYQDKFPLIDPIKGWEDKASKYKIKSYARVKTNFDDIKQAIYSTGPLLIGVWADSGFMKTEDNGIIQVKEKDTNPHAIVAFGWNNDGILVRNSWGNGWGSKVDQSSPRSYRTGEGIIQYCDTDRIFDAWSFIDETTPNVDTDRLNEANDFRSEVQKAKDWNETVKDSIGNGITNYPDTLEKEELLVMHYRHYLFNKFLKLN